MTRATSELPPGYEWSEDAARGVVRSSVARLLATDGAGAPRHYRFVGYAPGFYDTHALVVDVGPSWTRLVLPEWHPGMPVTIATSALGERRPGSWISCRADLG